MRPSLQQKLALIQVLKEKGVKGSYLSYFKDLNKLEEGGEIPKEISLYDRDFPIGRIPEYRDRIKELETTGESRREEIYKVASDSIGQPSPRVPWADAVGEGNNCLYTVGNICKQVDPSIVPISGNKQFADSRAKYNYRTEGFVPIKREDALPGDIIQNYEYNSDKDVVYPAHAMIATNDPNEFIYASGSPGTKIKREFYLHPDQKAYRYRGKEYSQNLDLINQVMNFPYQTPIQKMNSLPAKPIKLEKGGKIKRQFNANEFIQLLEHTRDNVPQPIIPESLESRNLTEHVRDVKNRPDKNKDYWSYGNQVGRNISKGIENVTKVGENIILPSVAGTAIGIGGIPAWMGYTYFGNEMSKLEEPYVEGTSAIAGQLIKNSTISEPIKRTAGINDLKTSYENFKEGNFWPGLYNLGTGLGGVYDSRWIPGKYDDYVDKALETLNLAGDLKDVYSSVEFKVKKRGKENKNKL